GASRVAAGRIRIGRTSLVGAAKLREAGEEGLIEPAFARLGLSASPGGSRRRVSALLASVLAHGSVFVAALVLLQQTTPPRPLTEVAVALQFVRSPDASPAPTVPSPSETAVSESTPAPPTEAPPVEPQSATAEPPLEPPPVPPDVPSSAPEPSPP